MQLKVISHQENMDANQGKADATLREIGTDQKLLGK
jgi:hypothetical protein